MSALSIVIAIIALLALLFILEEHLERISRVGGNLAEELKNRLVFRMIALAITLIIIIGFSEYTGVSMAKELFATVAGVIGFSVATVVQNEMAMRGLL